MADKNDNNKEIIDLYAGFEHVAQVTVEELATMKGDGHPVYVYPYSNAPKPDNN